MKDDEEVGRIRESQNKIYSMALDNHNNHLFYGSSDHEIRVYDLNENVILNSLKGHTKYIWVLQVTRDYRYLFSGGGDGVIRIWDLMNNYKIAHTIDHKTTIIAINLSRKSNRVYFGGSSYQPIKAVDIGKFLKGVKGMKRDVSTASLYSEAPELSINGSKPRLHSDNSGYLEPERMVGNHFSHRASEVVEDHSECQAQIDALLAQIEELQKELDRRNGEFDEMNEASKNRDYQFKLLESQIAALQKALQNKEEERQKQERKVQIGAEREELLNKKIELLAKKVADLSDDGQRSKELQQARAEAHRKEIWELENKLNQKTKENADLKKKVSELGDTIFELKRDMAEQRDNENRFRKKIKSLEIENEENTKELGNKDRRIRELEDQLRSKDFEVEKQKRNCKDRDEDIRDLKLNMINLESRLRESEDNAYKRGKAEASSNLQDQIDRLRKEHELELKNLRDKHEQSQNQIDRLNRENSNLSQRYHTEVTRNNTIRHSTHHTQDTTLLKDLIAQIKLVNERLNEEKQAQIQKNRLLTAEHFKLKIKLEKTTQRKVELEKQLKKVQINFAKLMNAQENLIRDSGTNINLSNSHTERYLEKLTRHLKIKIFEEDKEKGERYSLRANRSTVRGSVFKKRKVNEEITTEVETRTSRKVTNTEMSYGNMQTQKQTFVRNHFDPNQKGGQAIVKHGKNHFVAKNEFLNNFEEFRNDGKRPSRNTNFSMEDPVHLRLSRNQK